MARKKRTARKKKEFENPLSKIPRAVFGIASLAFGVFFILAAFQIAGPAGTFSYRALASFLGPGYILLPLVFITGGVLFFTSWKEDISVSSAIGGILLVAALLAILALLPVGSGIVGTFIATPFVSLFGLIGALVFLIALALIGGILLFRFEFSLDNSLPSFRFRWMQKRDTADEDDNEESYEEEEECEEIDEADTEIEDDEDAEPTVTDFTHHGDGDDTDAPTIASYGEYKKPPLSLLGKDKGKPGVGDVKANANLIKRTFANFGINVEMDEVSIGPTVTRYAIKPAEGVRLSKIVGLQNNLELALAASPVRIEAPIPGKSLVGIEVPNTAKATVGLAGLIASGTWKKSKVPLLVAVGRDITGEPYFADIAKMPHTLIAGATGSGKSVAVHSVITSLLYRNGPDQLRMIMVDPKRVELTLYDGIPHLLTPVITDAKKAILSLKWAAKEMDRRYDVLQAHKVRDITSYHENILKGNEDDESGPETMPYIVFVLDELADIMQAYPRELEAGIVRLAQMSRAVGIHLVLSTQRPTVNVITGLIKANVPGRMALQVSSQVDSRAILDTGGAEKLLGAGDMLYMAGNMSKPIRLQTAFISESEVKKIVSYIKKNNAGDSSTISMTGDSIAITEPNDAIGISNMELEEDEEDELFGAAREAVLEANKASTSYLQRKLRIGYSRAARLIDMLEERGIVGPADGSRPREVLRPEEEVDEEQPYEDETIS